MSRSSMVSRRSPFFTFFPSVATPPSRKPSTLARKEYGIIGSTLPLLEMEERKVSREACTTATRADGRRLFKYSRNAPKRMANPSSNHTRLLSVRMPSSSGRSFPQQTKFRENCNKTRQLEGELHSEAISLVHDAISSMYGPIRPPRERSSSPPNVI